MTMWAPGVGVSSFNIYFGGLTPLSMSGTSQAAPHVAGAFAIARQQAPNRSVTDAIAALTSNGPWVKDLRNGVTKRRLAIVDSLQPTPVMGYGEAIEGDSGNPVVRVPFEFPLPVIRPIAAEWETYGQPPGANPGGFETAIAGIDYPVSSGTVNISSGSRRAVVDVPITPDTISEPDHAFTVLFPYPVGASPLLQQFGVGIGIIRDDDFAVKPGVGQVVRPASGTRILEIPVLLSRTPAHAVVMHWVTRNGTAIAGRDYVSASGTLVIPAGQNRGSVRITVNALGGLGTSVLTPARSLYVDFSNIVGADLSGTVGTGIITPPPLGTRPSWIGGIVVGPRPGGGLPWEE